MQGRSAVQGSTVRCRAVQNSTSQRRECRSAARVVQCRTVLHVRCAQRRAVPRSAAQRRGVPRSAAQRRGALRSVVQCRAVPRGAGGAAQFCTVLRSVVLRSAVQRRERITVQRSLTLCYAVQHSTSRKGAVSAVATTLLLCQTLPAQAPASLKLVAQHLLTMVTVWQMLEARAYP